MVILIAPGELLFAQNIEAHDGEMNDFTPGITYSVTPTGNLNAVDILPAGIYSSASAVYFVLVTGSEARFNLHFNLPTRLYPTGGSGNGWLSVSYTSHSGYLLGRDEYFDPKSDQVVMMAGGETLVVVVGAQFSVPELAAQDAYENSLGLTARNIATDSVCSASAVYDVNTVWYPWEPEYPEIDFNNLVGGRAYSLVADSTTTGSLHPHVSGMESAQQAELHIEGDQYSSILVTLDLPKFLTEHGTEDPLRCSYPSDAILWVDSMRRFDPSVPFRVTLDRLGRAVLKIGMNVSSRYDVRGNSFEGIGLCTAQYTGLKISPTNLRRSAQNVSQIPEVISVRVTLERTLPTILAIFQNYPNPFNPSTEIRYALPRAEQVTLRIYDVLGREVANLLNEFQPSGYHFVRWNPVGVAGGVYYYMIKAGGDVEAKKLIYLK